MVLKEYYLGNITVADLCDKYQISTSTLYRWKVVYLKHKRLFLGVLESIETPNHAQFIRGIMDKEDLSAALSSFFAKYRFSFLGRKHKSATESGSP
jgi:transposase-like protein